jgi:hypothetical protein
MRILCTALLCLAAACGGPSRTTQARFPGSPAMFDRASAKPEALEIADKVVAAAGGAAAWDKAKMIRWKQQIIHEGKVAMSGSQAWDRWNARHWAELDQPEGTNVGVKYEIYGDYKAGYVLSKQGNPQPLPTKDTMEALSRAKEAFPRDTTVMFAAFLLEEPGAKLEYQGKVKDEESGAEFHELKVTFDPKETARAGVAFHVFADVNTFQVGRVQLDDAKGDRYMYQLSNYQNVNGLQIATERKNLGSGETIKLSEIKAGEVNDELFTVPMFGPSTAS